MFAKLLKVASRSATRGTTMYQAKEMAEMLDQLEIKIERCKVLYEQYFMGIQKMPPSTIHREIDRDFRELKTGTIRNTATRFRLNALSQKLGSYNNYWRRVLRQIEKGTYIRDIKKLSRKVAAGEADVPDSVLAQLPRSMRDQILRARQKGQRKGAAMGRPTEEIPARIVNERPTMDFDRSQIHELGELSEDADFEKMFDAIQESPKPKRPPSMPPVPPPAKKTTPAAVPKKTANVPRGMTEPQMRALYNKYMEARKIVGNERQLTYNQLVRSLKDKTPKIMQQNRADRVDFKVVIKDNKAVLKAVPRKNDG